MAHPGHCPSPAQGRGPEEGIPQVPSAQVPGTQGTGTVGVHMWDWEEPYWGPGIQGLTITTSFSEAEMVNWQKRGCETSHPKPGSSKSQGS